MASGAVEKTAQAKHHIKLCPRYRPKLTVLPKYSVKSVADCHLQMFIGVVAVKEKNLKRTFFCKSNTAHQIIAEAVLDAATKFGSVEGSCFGLF